MKQVIFDTGPLVAWFCPRDQHHQWVRRAFLGIPPGGVVCEAVLTEVCHLAGREGVSNGKILEFVIDGGLQVVSLSDQLSAIRSLTETYADTPMDFADACIVRMAELHDDAHVCTTDTDFLVFRKNRAQAIPMIAPFAD